MFATMPLTAGAAFDPSTPANCAVWLRGDTVTLDGSNNVSSWTDKTGNGNHATQSTAGQRPTGTTATIGGQAALGFTAANSNNLVIPYAAALQPTNVSVFAVWRWNDSAHGNPFKAIMAHQSTSGWADGYALVNGPAGTDGQIEFFADLYSTYYAGNTYANTTARASVGVYDGANVSLFVDGASVGSPTALTGSITYSNNCQTVFGAYTTAGGTGAVTGFVSADIAEIAIYGRGLNSTELGQLHTYAAARYGTP